MNYQDRSVRFSPKAFSSGSAAGQPRRGRGFDSECGPPGFDPECSANIGLIAFPVSLGIGAGVGALVDSAIRKTLYAVAIRQRAQLTLAPVVTETGAACRFRNRLALTTNKLRVFSASVFVES